MEKNNKMYFKDQVRSTFTKVKVFIMQNGPYPCYIVILLDLCH